MKGFAKIGVAVLFLAAIILVLSQFSPVTAQAGGTESGNWTNLTFTYPVTNHSNVSNPWLFFNYSIDETDIEGCNIEVGNATGYQNLSCTTHSYYCECNTTYHADTTAGLWNNISLFVYNATHDLAISSYTFFRIDTTTPVISIRSFTRHNDTYNLYTNSTVWSRYDGTFSNLQDYIEIAWDYVDTTSANSTNNCEVEVIRETVSSTGVLTEISYRNFTYDQNITSFNATSIGTRYFEAKIPASLITDDVYQGLFYLRPHCTDAVSKIGYMGKNYWGVVTPIPADTWTPIGNIGSKTSLVDWINYSSRNGNISYVAVYPSNASGWLTHQYDTTTNDGATIDTSNSSALYVFTTNGWTLLRLNATNLETRINVNVSYNDTTGIASGNWRPFVNLRANTTKYLTNATDGSTTDQCGRAFEWIAWFNSSNTDCAGGCWVTYNNGWGINNETLVPFGTVIWYLTNTSHIIMTPPYRATAGAVGVCEFGSAP